MPFPVQSGRLPRMRVFSGVTWARDTYNNFQEQLSTVESIVTKHLQHRVAQSRSLISNYNHRKCIGLLDEYQILRITTIDNFGGYLTYLI